MSKLRCCFWILLIYVRLESVFGRCSSDEEETMLEDPFNPLLTMLQENPSNLFGIIQSAIKGSTEALKVDLQEQLQLLASRCRNKTQDVVEDALKGYEIRNLPLIKSIKAAADGRMDALQSLKDLGGLKAQKDTIVKEFQDQASSCKAVEENVLPIMQSMEESFRSCKKDFAMFEKTWKKIEDNVDQFVLHSQSNKEELLQLKSGQEDITKILNSQNILLEELRNSLEPMKLAIPFLPRTCLDHKRNGFTLTGSYTIFPNGKQQNRMEVKCDMEDEGGGWTVFLERIKNEDAMAHVNFNRTWQDYVTGFGEPSGEHWLGLKWLHLLTSSQSFEMKIEIRDIEKGLFTAKYELFKIKDYSTNYKMHVSGFKGNLDYDALGKVHKDAPFSTWDKDNDLLPTSNCAAANGGGWWYVKCHKAVLTATHSTSENRDQRTLRWFHQKNWLIITHAAMKIREKPS